MYTMVSIWKENNIYRLFLHNSNGNVNIPIGKELAEKIEEEMKIEICEIPF